ncbi:GTP-binding protein [Rhodopseudomonas sp. B29]|uniref:CobW family GTP-binding protein n=1 Tax=Rhodopseudomonas sp. B29 TaxID=95607 RepID=UPI000346D6ED|nr:CobW family GTP-binding protein [Rhodopseudomonas sp. B29]
MKAASATIPVTVIGGFLGAGKTTFVNRLLASGGSRSAVLVNDFGEINIDAGLIAGHDGATMTLTNGCICCSIGTSFVDTLSRVLDAQPPFERIVIEASGVGDPWKIAEIALIEPMLRLERVIVLADASRIVALLNDPQVGDTVRAQFARADVVLLNKCDLVDPARFFDAESKLLGIFPLKKIIKTVRGEMPALSELGDATPSLFVADSPEPKAIDHAEQFRSWSYRRAGAFDRRALTIALAALPPQLLRLKGSCRFAGEGGSAVLQLVDKVWSLSASESGSTDCGIELVGVGTADLPPASLLDALLDRALATEAVS